MLNKIIQKQLEEFGCEGNWLGTDEEFEDVKNFFDNKRFVMCPNIFEEIIFDLKDKCVIPIHELNNEDLLLRFDFLVDNGGGDFYDKDFTTFTDDGCVDGAYFNLEYSLNGFLEHMNENRFNC